MKLTHLTSLALCIGTGLAAQMEKRWTGSFELTEFEQQAPRVGEAAPALRLCDLEGRPRTLALERGRSVLLLAGSFN